MHDREDSRAPVVILFDFAKIREQARDVRVGAERIGQFGASDRVDLARFEQLAERLAAAIFLDRYRLQQRQHGRTAMRPRPIRRTLDPVDF